MFQLGQRVGVLLGTLARWRLWRRIFCPSTNVRSDAGHAIVLVAFGPCGDCKPLTLIACTTHLEPQALCTSACIVMATCWSSERYLKLLHENEQGDSQMACSTHQNGFSVLCASLATAPGSDTRGEARSFASKRSWLRPPLPHVLPVQLKRRLGQKVLSRSSNAFA